MLNVCPVVDALSANPTSVYLGSTIALSGSAHDTDAAPSALSLTWGASGGLLSNANAAKPTFTCTAPGAATITLSAADGDSACGDAQSVVATCGSDVSATFYTTKTRYRPRQDSKLMKANALLAFGVAGFTTPGCGNLAQVGIDEQKQLAARLLQRLQSYFASLVATAGNPAPRWLVWVSSGWVARATAPAFFCNHGAVGADGQTAAEYAAHLEDNLRSLLDRAKSGDRYRAPPVRRVYMSKGDGKRTRPIGIPAFEDKVLQRAVAMVPDAVYEQDFLDCSYGFAQGARRIKRCRPYGSRGWIWGAAGCWRQTSKISSGLSTWLGCERYFNKGCRWLSLKARATSPVAILSTAYRSETPCRL